jgi:hypothetical protein
MSYIVTVKEDSTLVVTASGPYRTRERAMQEVRRFQRLEDELDPDCGYVADIVELEDGPTIRRRMREAVAGGTIQP